MRKRASTAPPEKDATVLTLATSALRRARGLLLSRPDEGALLLLPCCDVHTAGMGHRLDIAFVDGGGSVLAAYRDVGPFRRLRCKEATAVIERFSTCSSPWFEQGDRVGVVPITGKKEVQP